MKILSCSLKNFASYKELNFDFQNQGLTLIQGPTGSGKSTLCDAVPWILFGRTAKDGSVDEVLRWPGTEVTEGTAVIDPGGADSVLTVVRTRGKNRNDLYFTTRGDDAPRRGKDLTDTQQHINYYLRELNIDLYLSGAYFHEFSSTAQFFTTTAKNRRSICEQVVDLSLAKNLQESLKNNTKKLELLLAEEETNKQSFIKEIKYLKNQLDSHKTKRVSWCDTRTSKVISLNEKLENFEEDKKIRVQQLMVKQKDFDKTKKTIIQKLSNSIEIDELLLALSGDKCLKCGAPKETALVKQIIATKQALIIQQTEKNPVSDEVIRTEQTKDNFYAEQLTQLMLEVSPYSEMIRAADSDLHLTEAQLAETTNKSVVLDAEIADLIILTDIVSDYRGATVKNTISSIQDKTNSMLSSYFDAEIRVEFSIKDADKLEVSIMKDGNNCSYTQLSKGQRQMLKLCFGIAAMRGVSNFSGVKFNQVFFDESLDGLDESMKVKALYLFRSLETEYDSIFLVEHSNEIKAMIDNSYVVSLIDGASKIEKM